MRGKYPDSNITLKAGSGGIFNVTCDGTLIYSKNDTQRFPNEGEISGLIEHKRK